MTPREIIEVSYASGVWGHQNTLLADIEEHRKSGFVLETPEYFFMWRMVGVDWPLERLRDPSQSLPGGILAWLWAVSGDFRAGAAAALGICPECRFVGYDRRGKPRIVELERFLQ